MNQGTQHLELLEKGAPETLFSVLWCPSKGTGEKEEWNDGKD